MQKEADDKVPESKKEEVNDPDKENKLRKLNQWSLKVKLNELRFVSSKNLLLIHPLFNGTNV